MPIYDRPVRLLMRDMVAELGLGPDSVITRAQALEWFRQKYPKIKPATVSAHLVRTSTNATSRVHYNVNPQGDDDVFYQLDRSCYRLYDEEKDPPPIYAKALRGVIQERELEQIPGPCDVNDESESLFWHSVETFAEGVQVQHIATFGLQTCDIDEAVRAVRERCPDFDHVPVVNGGRIVGVLELSPEQPRSTVRACYRPLDENMLITADTSLEPSLVLLAQVPFYRLVVRESRIEGIVTRSDLLKLPVRMLGFARAVHFELVMAARIRQHFGASDAWLFSLDGEEQTRLCSLFERLAAQRSELTLLDLTSFRQKRSITETVFEPDQPTGRALKQIEDLRNDVAHTRRFIGGRDTVCGFVESIEQAKRLTAEWKSYLTPCPRPEN